MSDADMPGEEELQAVADEEGLPVEQCVSCTPLFLNVWLLVQNARLASELSVPSSWTGDLVCLAICKVLSELHNTTKRQLWSALAGCVLRWRHHRLQLSS